MSERRKATNTIHCLGGGGWQLEALLRDDSTSPHFIAERGLLQTELHNIVAQQAVLQQKW